MNLSKVLTPLILLFAACSPKMNTLTLHGKVTMRLFNSRYLVNGVEQQLKAGRIQLQSEGAEIFIEKLKYCLYLRCLQL